MSEFAAWVTGLDRPGIIAAISGVLFDQGCNLEDCSMTILSGHFAMTLLATGPDEVTAGALEVALRGAVEPLGLTVAVRDVEERPEEEVEGATFMVAVYGADRPGIVHRISQTLAERGVNITDLNTRVIGDPGEPVYAMQLEVTVPASVDAEELSAALHDVGAELGVDTSIHAVEADVL
ncbi:MAG: ACT domain-containing protein [Actinobacteria bacterium]|nr:ACT domain-containing protein [Actinomycetota bacterium]